MMLRRHSAAAALLRRGIFAVNKRKGITSAATLKRLKEIFRRGMDGTRAHYSIRNMNTSDIKLGHGGTLDYTAHGVLVVGTNWGCKDLPLLLEGSKTYLVKGQLGIETDTYNETGQIVDEQPFAHVTERDVEKMLSLFIGDVLQKAPVYSALKVNGRRMSDLAREGTILEPKKRIVKCHGITLKAFNPPFYTLSVRCGGGFYVRSLIHDIGKALGTCSHVCELQRTEVGPFNLLYDCLSEQEWNLENVLRLVSRCKLKFDRYYKIRKKELDEWIPQVE